MSETSQERINRLNREIEDEKRKQQFCQHTWGKPFSNPEKGGEYVIDWASGLQPCGSDPYYKQIWQEKWTPRWTRTCTKCGKEEHTYTKKVVHVDEEPDFGK